MEKGNIATINLQDFKSFIKKGTITTISLEDFKPFSEKFTYLDDDIMVANGMENLPYNHGQAIRMNFFLILFCEEGYMQLNVNGTTYMLKERDTLICLPTMVVSETMLSPVHKINIMAFSTQFLQRTIKKEKDTANTFGYIYKHPIRHTSGEEQTSTFTCYRELLLAKIAEPAHRYRKDILQYLFSALFYEILTDIQRRSEQEGTSPNEEKDLASKRAGYVFKRFMQELAKDNGQHRSVNYFADRLCYSPKYVSTVVKQMSGRTALDWINEVAVEQIRQKLTFSDKSIKEIAEEMNFPNQSFFGKYVKAHLGMSPGQYMHKGRL